MGVLDAVRASIRRVVAPADERGLSLVAATFCASRAAAFFAGVRFDASDLAGFWHFAPKHLLETRLGETIFFLHFQPPLFNLYLGCVLKIFGEWATVAFGASFFVLGLATALSLFVLMRRLGVGERAALVSTALFSSSPASLLFENYLFYELPVAALLVFSALALDVALESGSVRAFTTFFSLLATLVLTRALFHPVVRVLAALGLGASLARYRYAILRGFAVPALVVLAVCVKNWIVFDNFGTSSWLGMGLARMTLRNVDPEVKAAWVREGAVSPAAAVHPPSSIAAYAAVMPLPGDTRIPVLDEPFKPGGDLNLHHHAYVRISKTLLADDWVALRREPGVFAGAVKEALARFFRPASTWHPLAKNRRHIGLVDRVYNAIFHFGERGGPMLVLLPGAMAFAWLRSRRRDLRREHRAILLFLVGVMLYVLASGTLLEPLENMRFRYALEPYIAALIGLGVTSLSRLRAPGSQ
jgi:hypothetical protein